MRLKDYPADLHIHSALSPCAEREMDPPMIFNHAAQLGVSVIAITDHNCAENLPAFMTEVPDDLWVIPGIELQTREEIHLVCLFSSLDGALAFADYVRRHLPKQLNAPQVFGEQSILNRKGEEIGQEEQLLLTSVDFGLEQAFDAVCSFQGLCYPAHVDRRAYSLVSQLGFLPPQLPVPTVEISYRTTGEEGKSCYGGYQLIQSSDAHALAEMGRGCSILRMEELTWTELKAAFYHEDGRHIQV
jgi:PHP family Zn ribbon phosphoesterase